MKRHDFPTALWTAAFVALLGVGAVAAEPKPTPEAKARFKAGLEALRSNRNDEAYREFKEVYALTQKWTALGNLGIAAGRLERDGEAIDARQSYLDQGGDEIRAKEALQVRRDLERLRAGIATVTLEAPGQLSIIDTRVGGPDGSVVNRYGPFEGRAELRVRAGEHQFQLERAGAVSSPPVWSVVLLAGDTATHSFAEETERELAADFDGAQGSSAATLSVGEEDVAAPSHTAAYVLWGSGAAAGAVAAGLYLNANAIQDDADEAFGRSCSSGLLDPGAGCVRSTAGDKKAASWRTASLVTGIGAAGAVIAGTVLYFIVPTSSETSSTEPGAGEATVRPWLGPNGVGVSGNF